jgi:hypothetical protein
MCRAGRKVHAPEGILPVVRELVEGRRPCKLGSVPPSLFHQRARCLCLRFLVSGRPCARSTRTPPLQTAPPRSRPSECRSSSWKAARWTAYLCLPMRKLSDGTWWSTCGHATSECRCKHVGPRTLVDRPGLGSGWKVKIPSWTRLVGQSVVWLSWEHNGPNILCPRGGSWEVR